MEKRILLAFILSFGVLYAFRSFYVPAEPATDATTIPVVAEPPSAPALAPPVNTPFTGAATVAAGVEPQGDVRGDEPEDAIVDTPLYRATVSNVGGVVRSYTLKAYTDAQGKPIELININAGSKVGWPIVVVTGDAAVDQMIATATFAIRHSDRSVEMEYAGEGIHVLKSLRFNPAKYEFELSTSVSKEGKSLPHSIVWQGSFGDQSVTEDATRKNVVYATAGKFQRINIAGIGEPSEVMSGLAGIEDQYFLAAFLLANTGSIKIRRQEYTQGEDQIATAQLSVPAEGSVPLRIYLGPKDERWLRQSDPQLPAVIDYGFFGFIAQPLIVGLLWLHSYIGNFGWAIIILTVVINLVLFPLRLKQQVSMQRMQKIQPHMRTLQDRYKKLKANDPRRAQVQSEMMNLYKEHGVNPMGGCLPLLLQIPFFAAIWTMLSVSIELRQAPWMLWIHDLSQPDPFYVIPILMSVAMVIMQKMTPTTVDPAQAKMMMIMPLVFAVMFLRAQSGLTLYWLTSNVVGIGQQFFINKYWTPYTEAKLQARSPRKEPPTE